MGGITLAVFDFDGTLIRGDSITAYLRFARQRGFVTFSELAAAGWAAVRFRLGLTDAASAKTISLRFRKRADSPQLDALDEAFARQLLARVYPDGLARIAACRAQGDRIILLSASTINYMRFVAAGLQADHLICSGLDAQGRVFPNVRGEEKVQQLKSYISSLPEPPDLQASSAYGDSASDIPLLELTGHPYLVNPGRKALKKAQGRIPVLTWRK